MSENVFENKYAKNPADPTSTPLILKTGDAHFKDRFDQLIKNHSPQIIDTYPAQCKELIKLRNPANPLSEEGLTGAFLKKTNGLDPSLSGNWIYYPWSNKLVHLLEKEEFVEVRTNRNRNKITREEQLTLSGKTVGIIGLSVGQSVAMTMATERVCGTLRLADFDTLDLSNLNRIRSGIHNLGLNKALVTAREIAEIDPYLNVEIFTDGITEDNMEDFFNGSGPMDLLVEVCDSLPVKIGSRVKAREKRIPVLMDTNDRGMMDIERFDLEPSRELFHGLVPEETLLNASTLSKQEVLGMLMQLISFENASERLKASVPEIGKTISTWPQLASSVVLGGGVTCAVARKILLGERVQSGRHYMDAEAIR